MDVNGTLSGVRQQLLFSIGLVLEIITDFHLVPQKTLIIRQTVFGTNVCLSI